MGLLDYFGEPTWAKSIRSMQDIILAKLDVIEGKVDKMARSVDDALKDLVDVAKGALDSLKAARQEIEDLKSSDAADDAAQIQDVLDSVAAKIDAATASLSSSPDVPVDETPVDPTEGGEVSP